MFFSLDLEDTSVIWLFSSSDLHFYGPLCQVISLPNLCSRCLSSKLHRNHSGFLKICPYLVNSFISQHSQPFHLCSLGMAVTQAELCLHTLICGGSPSGMFSKSFSTQSVSNCASRSRGSVASSARIPLKKVNNFLPFATYHPFRYSFIITICCNVYI